MAKGFPRTAASWWFLGGAIAAAAVFVTLGATYLIFSVTRVQPWLQGVVKGLGFLLTPLVVLGVGYLVFYVRRRWVLRDYIKRARTDPARVVPSAGTVIGEVIGRDELCQVLMDNLRDPATARPNIIVGGPGAGKTAVLLRLTQLLADRTVVPVAVRMRDMDIKNFDFETEAFRRFTTEVNSRLLSQGDADRTWRRLRRDNRVVVLADGLEEALIPTTTNDLTPAGDAAAGDDRMGLIQLAVAKAAREGLLLVIASRFEDPIRVMEVTVTELEPMGESPALDFLAGPAKDRSRYAHLIQCADVAESPLYLQLVHDLDQRDRLQRLTPGEDWLRHLTEAPVLTSQLDQHIDRAELRLAILDSWHDALMDGKLYEDYDLNPQLRRRTSDVLAALACVGLSKDSAHVKFLDLIDGLNSDAAGGPPCGVFATALCEGLMAVPHRIDSPNEQSRKDWIKSHCPDWLPELCAQAAIMGSELGIVENHKGAIRFRHNALQTYLGSLFFPHALGDRRYREAALAKGGREFLTALVMYSRRTEHDLARRTALGRNEGRSECPKDLVRYIGDELRKVASGQWRPIKAMEMYATALEIDRVTSCPAYSDIVGEIQNDWKTWALPAGQQDFAIVDAKLSLVETMGQSAQWIAGRADHAGENGPKLAYDAMFDIAVGEDEHAVKLALVHQIGDGGNNALAQLSERRRTWWHEWEQWWTTTIGDQPAPTAQSAEAPLDPGGAPPGGSSHATTEDPGTKRRQLWRQGMVWAWLAPLLFSTVEDDHRPAPDDETDGPRQHAGDSADATDHRGSAEQVGAEGAASNLKRWITEYPGRIDPSHPAKRPWISLEIALAQGFKHAANRRPANFERYERRRNMLVEQAELALRHSRFWFAQLSLIQALTLLSLPKDPNTPLPDRGHGSDPHALVEYWLAIAGTGFGEVEDGAGHRNHPFVREAAKLSENALVTRRPEQFCWIDEEDAARTVGSLAPLHRTRLTTRRAPPPDRPREHRLWLLPSAGWASLHPRARELLGDVLVMLNLTERGAGKDPEVRESRLSRSDRADLPPCITTDRTSMNVNDTISSVGASEPGSACHDDCRFRLCPYPPAGEPSYHAELPEGFCRKLAQTNERGRYERQLSRAEHRRFWLAMMRRVQPKVRYGGLPAAPRLD